jgi:SNF2 family DNA or RNA helicase
MILDGTPAGESPLAMYPQMAFLSTAILGADNSALFRAKYAEIKIEERRDGRRYPVITGFQNLDEMAERLTPVSFRCTRKECYDIPDKVYSPYRFSLGQEQRRVYDSLAEKYEAELSDGTSVDARMVLTRYLRLQQISSNYWPPTTELTLCPDCNGAGCEECDGLGGIPLMTSIKVISNHDSRLEAFREVLQLHPAAPLIVWARFTLDVDKCMQALVDAGRKPVRYDGRVSRDDKERNKRAFQAGEASDIVCNQGAAQRGINLGRARGHVFYSNTYSGIQRVQAEDRTEVAGRTEGTFVIDLLARDTKDEDIVEAHVKKLSLSEMVMQRRGYTDHA